MAKHAASSEEAEQRPRRKKKGGALSRFIQIVSGIVFLGCLVALGCLGFQYWYQSNAYSELQDNFTIDDTEANVEEITLADLKVDWDALKATNEDVVGWIWVPGTVINYPVVQGVDDEQYLHTAFDKSTGWLSSKGTIFMEATNSHDLSDRNMALFGHHMRDGSMFASIEGWSSQEEFDKHRTIYFLTPEGNYRLTTFAHVITTGTDAIIQTAFQDDEAYRAYVQDKLDRSVVSQDDIKASDVQQSFALATCEYTHANGRAVSFCSVVETTNPDDEYVQPSKGEPLGLSADDLKELTGK